MYYTQFILRTKEEFINSNSYGGEGGSDFNIIIGIDRTVIVI